MELKIYKNWFAPKVKSESKMIHGIYTKLCNYSCTFCSQNKRNLYCGFREFDLDSFEKEVITLMDSSDLFKLTGGEPTMIPEIESVVRIINKNNGKVFLDTNASKKGLILKLVDEKMINVLGVSIKGVTPNEAKEKSGNRSRQLCWDNVIDVCNYAYGKTEVILTYVVDSKTNFDELFNFCYRIASNQIKVNYLKLNNLYGDDLPDKNLEMLDDVLFLNLCEEIVEKYPELKNRLIAIPNLNAVRNKESILYF